MFYNGDIRVGKVNELGVNKTLKGQEKIYAITKNQKILNTQATLEYS